MNRTECFAMTELQLEIFDYLLFHTWSDAMTTFGIRSKRVIRTILIRTSLGYQWYPGHPGGALPYLNHNKEQRLLHLLEKHSENQDCLLTSEVVSLAFTMKQEMLIEARASLIKRRSLTLASEIDLNPLPPSSSWLQDCIHRHKLRTVASRSIENERTMSCDRGKITEYFLKFGCLFNRDPRLIFGADETDMKPGNRFKAVSTKTHQGFTHNEESTKHITAMCCHSAGGMAVPPLILLTGLANLPQELKSIDICSPDVAWFASSSRGYMNEQTYYIWAVLFTTWLSGYRAMFLPDNIKRSNILLLVDGAMVHKCPEALNLFVLHNVSVLVLPAHTTHLLQAFDVLLASFLKSNFKRFLIEEKQTQKFLRDKITKAAYNRLILVRSFIRVWRCTATPEFCSRSFEVVGVFPLNPFRVLESPFVTNEKIVNDDVHGINNQVTTTPETISSLFAQLKGEQMPQLTQDWNHQSFDQLIIWMMNQSPEGGKLLSCPCALFWPDDFGVWSLRRTFLAPSEVPFDPSVVFKILKKLTVKNGDEGEKIIEEFIESQNNEIRSIEGETIRIAARQMARDLSMQLMHQRFEEIEPLMSGMLKNSLSNLIGGKILESDLSTEVKQLLITK